MKTNTGIFALLLGVLAVCLPATPSLALPAVPGEPTTLQPPPKAPCPAPVTKAEKKDVAVARSGLNTLVYDHYWLRPACDRPMVLSVADGDFLQVRIENTDPTQFTYALKAIPDELTPGTTSGATGAGLPVTRWSDASVTMQHDQKFHRYQLSIGLRPDLAAAPGKGATVNRGDPSTSLDKASGPLGQRRRSPEPELFPVSFDVWVKTKQGLEVSFMGGAAFSGLRSPRYFLKTDDHGTADEKDDTKTVEDDPGGRDGFRPDIVAVTNLRFPAWFRGFGLAFGVGMNNESDPRFFFGPSYLFGRHLLLHAGWAGGQVDRLPNGQALHVAPMAGDNTLAELPKRFRSAFYASVSFGAIPDSDKNFKSAFSGAQKPVKPEAAPAQPPGEEPPPPAPPGASIDLTKASGEYVSDVDKSIKATAAVSGTKPEDFRLTVSITGASGQKIELKDLKKTPDAFVDADNVNSCAFLRNGGKLALHCDAGQKLLFKGTRAAAE